MNAVQSPELSSDVLLQLRLKADGRLLRVGQVYDNLLVLREPIDLPPSEAELLITINGRTKSHGIYLHHGASSLCDEVPFL